MEIRWEYLLAMVIVVVVGIVVYSGNATARDLIEAIAIAVGLVGGGGLLRVFSTELSSMRALLLADK